MRKIKTKTNSELLATSAFKQLREAKKLSLYALEKDTGLHYVTIHRIERGIQHATRDQARKLANALGVQIESIFIDKSETAA